MADEPAALSIGAVFGDPDATNMAWKRAINALGLQVQSARVGVVSPLRVNVVYHVNGRLVPNEFAGVRTGRFSAKNAHLMVQAAVPDAASPDQPEVLMDLLRDAVSAAEEFGRKKKIADSLEAIRGLVSELDKDAIKGG